MNAPITVVQVIAYVESKGDSFAYRFEPLTYASTLNTQGKTAMQQILAQIVKVHNCSYQSARVIYSSSFGKYQIMGFNLYGQLNVQKSFGEFMTDDSLQDLAFNTFLKQKNIASITVDQLATDKNTRIKFGNIYNGNGNDYAGSIVSALQHFGVKVS